MKISKKIVLISGANRGIGLEVARQLGTLGFYVLLAARSKEKGSEALSELQQGAWEGEFLELDVSSPQSIQEATKNIENKFGRLDVLINNAGILPDADYKALDVPLRLVHETIQTNALGPLLLVQALYPLLAKSKEGRIINLSSGLGQLDDMEGGYPAYRLSKTMMNALTKMFATELRAQSIVVNSVCPGWVRTDMGGPHANRTVKEGADTIVWLATEAPKEVNGQYLRDRKPIPW